MSLTFSGLERLEEGQRGIEGFFGAQAIPSVDSPTPADAPIPKSAAMKRSRSPSPPPTPSNRSVTSFPPATANQPPKRRLPTLHTGKTKSPLEGFLVKNGESSKQPKFQTPVPSAPTEVINLLDDDDDVPSTTDYTCPRCKTTLTVEPGPNEKMQLTEKRREHEDYHFALDLQDGPSPERTVKPKPGAEAKKKAKKTEGIKAFFAPRPAGKGG